MCSRNDGCNHDDFTLQMENGEPLDAGDLEVVSDFVSDKGLREGTVTEDGLLIARPGFESYVARRICREIIVRKRKDETEAFGKQAAAVVWSVKAEYYITHKLGM